MDHISKEVIVLEPVVDVHLLIVYSQCAGLDAALLKKKLREIFFLCNYNISVSQLKVPTRQPIIVNYKRTRQGSVNRAVLLIGSMLAFGSSRPWFNSQRVRKLFLCYF